MFPTYRKYSTEGKKHRSAIGFSKYGKRREMMRDVLLCVWPFQRFSEPAPYVRKANHIIRNPAQVLPKGPKVARYDIIPIVRYTLPSSAYRALLVNVCVRATLHRSEVKLEGHTIELIRCCRRCYEYSRTASADHCTAVVLLAAAAGYLATGQQCVQQQ